MATAQLIGEDLVEAQTCQVLDAFGSVRAQVETQAFQSDLFGNDEPGVEAGTDSLEHAMAELRKNITALADNSEWSDDSAARRMLVQMLRVEHAVSRALSRGEDPDLEAHRQLTLLGDLIGTAQRRAKREQLDDPVEAAVFCVQALQGVDDAEIASLLDVDPKTIANWRSQRTRSVRKNRDRVVLCAQLLFDLRNSWTARGAVMWFYSEHPGLDGQTPIELIQEDPLRHADRLRELTRAERGQLDT